MRSEATPAYDQKWRMPAELEEYLSERTRGAPEDRKGYVASLECAGYPADRIAGLLLPRPTALRRWEAAEFARAHAHRWLLGNTPAGT